jgi:uncharacterized protein (DUF58 family)
MRNFVLFLLVLFVIAAFLRVDFFFTVVYLLFVVYLLSRIWTRRTLENLRVCRCFTDHAFFGDQVTVDLSVHNADWLPVPWLQVHEMLPVELVTPPFHRRVVSIGPRERRDFRYTLYCRRRGYYPVGPLTLHTGDLLGVVRDRMRQAEPDHLTVYPRIVSLQELGLPTRSPFVALPARSPLFEDPARVMGVRDYQRGDSPRRIHWTATASAGRLLVKQYQPAIARETLICLDLNEEGYGQRQRYTATELAIVIAASIANHIIVREGLPAGLTTEAQDPSLDDAGQVRPVRFYLPPRSERAHLMSMLEVLARVQISSSSTPFVDLLRRESVNLSWGSTLVLITGRESGDLFDTTVYLRRAGFVVALILAQPAYPSAELQRRADLLGVNIHRVWKDQDLEEWR